jgi:hypothetical protein
MLGKCSNPSCAASFRYLRDGRLFRLEADPKLGASKPSRVEYFWLCDRCSSNMSLQISSRGNVLPVLLTTPNCGYDGHTIAVNRHGCESGRENCVHDLACRGRVLLHLQGAASRLSATAVASISMCPISSVAASSSRSRYFFEPRVPPRLTKTLQLSLILQFEFETECSDPPLPEMLNT